MKTAEIKITVELDDNNNPDNILWESTDADTTDKVPVKAMILALWDHNYKNSMRIDLWTKDMPVDEMKLFFHQTLVAMSDTFRRATDDEKMADTMKDFCDYFAEKLDLVK